MKARLTLLWCGIFLVMVGIGCASSDNKSIKQGAQNQVGSQKTVPNVRTFPDDEDEDSRRNKAQEDEDDRDRNDSGSGDSRCYKADEFICAVELAITEQTNELRGGLEPMRYSRSLSYVSRLWSQSMAARGGIGHQGFPNERFKDFVAEFGTQPRMASENVAYTFAGSNDPKRIAEQLVEMWWTSAGHRRNMIQLHPAIGVGVWRDGNRIYGTQIFGDARD